MLAVSMKNSKSTILGLESVYTHSGLALDPWCLCKLCHIGGGGGTSYEYLVQVLGECLPPPPPPPPRHFFLAMALVTCT